MNLIDRRLSYLQRGRGKDVAGTCLHVSEVRPVEEVSD